MLGLRFTLPLLLLAVAAQAQIIPLCPLDQPGCCTANRDCNDRNDCNGRERCDDGSGACLAGEPVVCVNAGPCAIGACIPVIGECIIVTAQDGTACDDGNACTESDACQSGQCGGIARVCDDDDPCTADLCDALVGCAKAPNPDGTDCNDHNPCTRDDACAVGSCVGVIRQDGVGCNDRDPCTLDDACFEGVCTGAPRPCDDDDPCTVDSCEAAADGCVNAPLPPATPCDDGDACTTADQCGAGGCEGTPIGCAPPGPCRALGTCDPPTGSCTYAPLPDDIPCFDGDHCTRADTCQAGSCVGTDPVVCPTQGQCHAEGVCDPATGACTNPPLPENTACSDGNACTRVDRCQQGTCAGGDPVVCTARDPCHLPGTCDPGTGVCSNPPRPDGERCDDGNGCTVGDRCSGGTCTSVPRSCDDGAPCTNDTCAGGLCRHDPVDARCDSGECALARCDPGAERADETGCVREPVGEGEVCTDDGVACTEDRCAAGTCRHEPLDARCVSEETCAPAVCAPTDPSAASTGCLAVPERALGVECREDGDPCTDDTCAGGECGHAPVPSKATCDPVRPVWDRAVALAALARGLANETVVALVPNDLGSQIAGPASEVAGTLELIVDILAGRAQESPAEAIALALRGRAFPTGLPETVAQQRARIAFTQARKTPTEVRAFLQELAVAQQRALVSGVTAVDFRRRGRDLLRGAKALKRDLKRLQTVSRSFTR